MKKKQNPENYSNTNQALKELFCHQADSLLTSDQINTTIQQEQKNFAKAAEAGLPCSCWIGNNINRYCKDLIRRNQPGFFLYYLLGLFTEYSSFLFFWIGIRQIISFFTGNKQAFQESVPLNCSLFVLAAYLVFREISLGRCRQFLHSDSTKMPSRLPQSLTAAILLFIGLGSMSLFETGLLSLSLLQSFLLYSGLLFLSGIHNTIYSSHFPDFFLILLQYLSRSQDGNWQDRAKLYIQKNRQQHESADEEIFTHSLRQRLVSNRAYYVLGAFIVLISTILCLVQLLQHTFTVTLLLFILLTIILLLVLLGCIISCNLILQQLKVHQCADEQSQK